jgi:hypothetical protein
MPGVVIQLDGRGVPQARDLAMTFSGSFLYLRKSPRLLRLSRRVVLDDESKI